ncbi:MAG: SUMF1/EgtB/PvdO family nonheme iron enzyme [Planctomycetia bacterium]|nr:SUMF1/EgtB/PvdO family nonheme iron enzyme [Planctomycetia bacterium]
MLRKTLGVFFLVASALCASMAAAEEAPSAKKEAVFNNGLVPTNTCESARLMINDLIRTNGDKYPRGKEFLDRLDKIEQELAQNPNSPDAKKALDSLIREASLANPLLDFDKLLVVKRNPAHGWGFPGLNAYTNMTINKEGWDCEICVLSDLRAEEPKLTPIYRHPHRNSIIRDVDIHFDADRIMFSAANEKGRWAVYQITTDGKNLTELTPNDQEDVDWFDSTYLPEKDYFVTCSTAGMQGLPCENGSRPMVNIYRVNAKTKHVRQLTFEQDSDWHPTILPNGRVMYLRWEYSDIPHYFSRILFTMSPDGRQQKALWGSGSYFPTAYKHARPVPGHPSMVIGIVGGHHAEPESGRLVLIDPSLGDSYPFTPIISSKEWGPENSHLNIMTKVYPKEVTGCVQEIPGHNREVFGNVYDNQGGESEIRFIYPYPLSDKYFIVNMKRRQDKTFGVWLVDIFDNMTLLKTIPEGYSLFEPQPLVKRETPPILPDFTNHDDPDATIFITNVNLGRGLEGVPAGKAKFLRVFAYHFGYINSGGHESTGQNSGWDIKRILGTVPIESDGSVCFKAPANTPLAFHVLDENGAAIQIMRSWTVAMPGERQACIGCHERPNDAVPAIQTIAGRKPPQEIRPWYGPERAFGYEAEIQPLLDKYCVSCHNDKKKGENGNLSLVARNTGNWRTDTSYAELNPFVRKYGTEFDLRMLKPMEYHVSTCELIQRLRAGHHGVQLDAEAWDRLYTWIDLNAPYRGMWQNPHYEKRRRELQELYAFHTANPEDEYREALALSKSRKVEPVVPQEVPPPLPDTLKTSAFPFDAAKAKAMQGENARMEIEIEGVKFAFVRIPAGEFIIGAQPDDATLSYELPRSIVRIERPFWMSETEITNAQYAVFDPDHETGYHREDGKDHITPGYIAIHPDQPVSRVRWLDAQKFATWMARKTGRKVLLPTEAQWEWAARAGSQSAFFYGDRDSDFSKWANLADAGLRRTYTNWDGGSKIHARRWYPEGQRYPLRDDRFTDKWFVVDYVKQYEPNPWGLYDMIGNVSEWTRSDFRAYPYSENDGRNGLNPGTPKVVRGGSWNDRPAACGSATRKPYEPWQQVFDVGVRLIIEE